MNTKRILTLLLALLMAASVLFATVSCGVTDDVRFALRDLTGCPVEVVDEDFAGGKKP